MSKYEVSLRIQSEWGKYGPKQTPYLDTFHEMNGKPARYYETKKDPQKYFSFRVKNCWFLQVPGKFPSNLHYGN